MIAPRTPVALTAALAVLTGLAAGCGADTERPQRGTPTMEQQARAVVERFGAASARHDYQTICDDLLASELIKSVEAIGLPCEVAFQKGLADVRNPRIQVRQVSVEGARALVSVHSTAAGQPPSDDAVQLVREDGQWRIASLVQPGGQSTTTTTTTTTAPSATTTTTTPTATTTVPTPDHDDRDANARKKQR